MALLKKNKKKVKVEEPKVVKSKKVSSVPTIRTIPQHSNA